MTAPVTEWTDTGWADPPLDELAQAAFSAYLDAARAQGQAHKRLASGSWAAARAVVEILRNGGWIRPPHRSAHGTSSGYHSGCRCRFCTQAHTLLGASEKHWNRVQGHNKIKAEGP